MTPAGSPEIQNWIPTRFLGTRPYAGWQVSIVVAIVMAVAGLTGSASGGQSIALPLLAPFYLGQGVNPDALHRVVSISSGALDSLPHNGYVVTTIRWIRRESYSAAYPGVAAMTVILPAIGAALAVVLFSL